MANEPEKPRDDGDEAPRDSRPHLPPLEPPPGITPVNGHWDWSMYWQIDGGVNPSWIADPASRAEARAALDEFAERMREFSRLGHHLDEASMASIRPAGHPTPGVRVSEMGQIRSWVEANAHALKPYATSTSNHSALWCSSILDRVTDGVVASDRDAIRLAFQFIADDPLCFDGRGTKQRLLKKLKHVDLPAWRHWLPRLKATAAKFDKDDYKPQEYNDLVRLIRRLEEA